MILAAGRGERMGALTALQPKPLLTIGGRPLIEHHVARLAASGVDEIVINLSYRGTQIREHLGRRQPLRRVDRVQRGRRAAARDRRRHRARAAAAWARAVRARELRRVHRLRLSRPGRGAARADARARAESRASSARRLRARCGGFRVGVAAAAHVRGYGGLRSALVRGPRPGPPAAEAVARRGDRAARAQRSRVRRGCGSTSARPSGSRRRARSPRGANPCVSTRSFAARPRFACALR